ncbi:hypothetical protein MSPP1_003861 [Malassezia sp. CBS 17886]|nr:hypothetical protein MSPP1_003861 [Malassezia sp. CBS 17886]
MGIDDRVADLPQSRLGTKEYWDEVYEYVPLGETVKTFKEIGDEGEVWFGEDSVDRMVVYISDLLANAPTSAPPYIIDLGTGNGYFLFALLDVQDEMGPGAVEPERLLGIDYSPASIELARAVGARRRDGCERVQFEEADLRDSGVVAVLKQEANAGAGWDLAKFDAPQIALSSEPVQGTRPVDLYIDAVKTLTRSPGADGTRGGVFLISSCNFTEAELTKYFERAATDSMPLYADLCVRLQNASRGKLRSVPVPNTKANMWIASILLQHGFIYNVTRGTVAGPNAAEWNAASDVRRRLWVDLKYRADDRPVLESMNLVSKPSRRLSMTNEELIRFVTGRRAKFVTPLRAGEIGIVDCGKHGWFEAKDAMRRKLDGEVVCRVS